MSTPVSDVYPLFRVFDFTRLMYFVGRSCRFSPARVFVVGIFSVLVVLMRKARSIGDGLELLL